MPERLLYVMGEMTQSVRTAAYGVYVMIGIMAFPAVYAGAQVREKVVSA